MRINGSTKTKNTVGISVHTEWIAAVVYFRDFVNTCVSYHIFSTGMLSATASLGLILLWDVEGGLTQIDKFLYSQDEYIKSGSLLACGIVNARIRNECDPARALLSEHLINKSNIIRTGAVVG